MFKNIDYIDEVESDLIQKFFNIDCNKIHLHKQNIKNNLNKNTKHLRTIGYSDFKTILKFYKFEPKYGELKFWNMFNPLVNELPNIELPLIMSKVPLDYFWVDYVTDIDMNFNIVNNELIMKVKFSKNIYEKYLQLICCMMFISDFKKSQNSYSNIDTNKAWRWLYSKL